MKERAAEALKKAASDFINRESNRQTMITVTGVQVDQRGCANIFISAFPETGLHAATDFLNRNRDEFKRYLKKSVSLKYLPRVKFLPDPHLGGYSGAEEYNEEEK
ncbi:MAG: ribosome-binding factor A [Patescibacteria group bacterium UBA2163]